MTVVSEVGHWHTRGDVRTEVRLHHTFSNEFGVPSTLKHTTKGLGVFFPVWSCRTVFHEFHQWGSDRLWKTDVRGKHCTCTHTVPFSSQMELDEKRSERGWRPWLLDCLRSLNSLKPSQVPRGACIARFPPADGERRLTARDLVQLVVFVRRVTRLPSILTSSFAVQGHLHEVGRPGNRFAWHF